MDVFVPALIQGIMSADEVITITLFMIVCIFETIDYTYLTVVCTNPLSLHDTLTLQYRIALSALYGHFVNVQECFRECSKVHENVTSFAFSRLKQPSHKNQSAGFHRQPKKSDKVLFLKFCYKLFTHTSNIIAVNA